MREIIFRGLEIPYSENEDERWIYGSLQMDSSECNIRKTDDCIPRDVRRETVGQYTGLKDKNGKMIFEGDIVKTPNNTIFRVVFNDARFCIFSVEKDVFINDLGVFVGCFPIEIISNIHEETT